MTRISIGSSLSIIASSPRSSHALVDAPDVVMELKEDKGMQLLPLWQAVTREERFFTSVLHHELINNVTPFSHFLCSRIDVEPGVRVRDVGYEVCFFRDILS